MNRKISAPGLAVTAVLIWTTVASGAPAIPQFGTAEQARAMLERAVAALKDNQAAALKAFNDPKNTQFRERDLYVYCFNVGDGKFTAYQSPMLLGVNVREFKLPPNDPVGQRAYDAIHDVSEGNFITLEYQMPKPGTKQSATKQFLETRVGNQGCGVTYFK
ncbi:MAG: chemotaxis protein [Hyphomicrobiales bacterium]|nr:chemotaxis protein [Hyphomicrobiales bacterium]MDE2285045.1 chemotaxis protein [Hyphomicrobiales bacterium]